jgi:hypothetical protein
MESLEALRDARDASEYGKGGVQSPERSAEDLFLEVTSRLEIRSAEVGDLLVRLQIAERTQNILEEERWKPAEDLKRERERAERLEQDYKEVQEEVERLTVELKRAGRKRSNSAPNSNRVGGSSGEDGPEDKRAEGKPGC